MSNLKSSDTNYIKMLYELETSLRKKKQKKTKTIVRKISGILSFMSQDPMLLPRQPCEYFEDFEHGDSGERQWKTPSSSMRVHSVEPVKMMKMEKRM